MCKRKICLVIPTLGPGGMERVMAQLACNFDKKQTAEVHIVLYSRKREVFYPISESITIHKPKFHFNDRKRFISTVKTLLFLRKIIKSISPDTILSFGEGWNNFVLLSRIGLPYPIYIADRAEPGKKRNLIQKLLMKFLYRRANGIIVQTDTAKIIYEQSFKSNKITAIGNPIRTIETNGKSNPKENIVLSVGRLVDTKHFDQLIKMFSRIDKPGWKLVIVGGDSQKQNGMDSLRKLIQKYDLEDRVVLTGTVSNVDEYYSRSKIFAFTSSSEGFPNVIGEAMSAGLPVVAYDCVAGPSEMIDDGKTGFLVPLFNTEYFEVKLKKLMEDADLREKMGRKGAQKIKMFSVDKIGERYYSLIVDNP